MESRTIRRINAAKQIFQQPPIEYEHPNIFGIEDTNLVPNQIHTTAVPLPHLQPVVPEHEIEHEPMHEEVPQNIYQQTEHAALLNPNDLAVQEQYNTMTTEKLSGGRKSYIDTEVFLRSQERQRIVKRCHELAKRRKISTDSEKLKY